MQSASARLISLWVTKFSKDVVRVWVIEGLCSVGSFFRCGGGCRSAIMMLCGMTGDRLEVGTKRRNEIHIVLVVGFDLQKCCSGRTLLDVVLYFQIIGVSGHQVSGEAEG